VISSYRLGILIVLAVVLISAGFCFAWVDARGSQPARAGQDLGAGAFPLSEFQLVERSGRRVTRADLADRVCVASFIFTRCPLSCPRITAVMKGLEGRLAATDVLLLSFSVDPEHDTPAVLSEFARKYGASPERWWFLTGPKSSIYELVREGFKLALEQMPAQDRDSGTEAISHSDRLALVDHANVVGLFDSTDSGAMDALASQARLRALPPWARVLPAVNASLNCVCALLLISGWRMIRRHASLQQAGAGPREAGGLLHHSLVRAHLACMGMAVVASTMFLAFYLVYHFQAGSVPFRGSGMIRPLYFTILLSHTILATFGVVPLVILTLVKALKGQFESHVLVARVTFPIWLYVSVTGVVIYTMLYHLYPGLSSLSQS
jgi:protein SCO1/2/putative membrane protein